MRPIKFRAWNKMRNKMFPVKDIAFGEYGYVTSAEPQSPPFPLSHIELMQFTGLFDKNGKEIYEGDILSVHPNSEGNWIGKVLWHDRDCRFYVLYKWDKAQKCGEGRSKHDINSVKDNAEVIGNIYESPPVGEGK